jgi:hypothetical protein
MSMMRLGTVVVGVGAALILGGAVAADDDLAVVNRATTGEAHAAAEGEKAGPTPSRSPGTPPQWLKVRIVEKSGKKSRVSVNVPLALVHALGDECPIDWHMKAGRPGEARKIRLSEVLKALQSGQDIVQIEDEEATVKVWVE